MSVLDEELKMPVCVHVDNDGGVVNDVMIEVLQVLLDITQLLNSFLKFFLFPEVKFLALLVHVDHRIDL